MKILLLGATSNVGYSFLNKFSTDFEIVSTHRGDLPVELKKFHNVKFEKVDTYDKQAIETLVSQYSPEIIINTLANECR